MQGDLTFLQIFITQRPVIPQTFCLFRLRKAYIVLTLLAQRWPMAIDHRLCGSWCTCSRGVLAIMTDPSRYLSIAILRREQRYEMEQVSCITTGWLMFDEHSGTIDVFHPHHSSRTWYKWQVKLDLFSLAHASTPQLPSSRRNVQQAGGRLSSTACMMYVTFDWQTKWLCVRSLWLHLWLCWLSLLCDQLDFTAASVLNTRPMQAQSKHDCWHQHFKLKNI